MLSFLSGPESKQHTYILQPKEAVCIHFSIKKKIGSLHPLQSTENSGSLMPRHCMGQELTHKITE